MEEGYFELLWVLYELVVLVVWVESLQWGSVLHLLPEMWDPTKKVPKLILPELWQS